MTAETTQDVYSLPEYAAFLSAIRAQPADDTPRLVVADWLEEHGEEKYAEFIRVQCAGGVRPIRMSWLIPLEPFLGVMAHQLGYSASLGGVAHASGPHGKQVRFRRGFICEVRCPAADWLRHADALLARHPVERVTLTTWPAHGTKPGTISLTRNRFDGMTETDIAGQTVVLPSRLASYKRLLEARWQGVVFTLPF